MDCPRLRWWDRGVSRSGNTWPFHGEMSRNVLWQTSGLMTKGNNITIERNLIFETGQGTQTEGVDDEGSRLFDITMCVPHERHAAE